MLRRDARRAEKLENYEHRNSESNSSATYSEAEPTTEVLENLQSLRSFAAIAAKREEIKDDYHGMMQLVRHPSLSSFANMATTSLFGGGNGSSSPTISVRDVAKCIDHTALKVMTTKAEVTKLCQEAVEHGFASVCIAPYFVQTARNLLGPRDASHGVKVCTVVGFPLGNTSREAKALEAVKAVADGAEEIDMVINMSALKSGDIEYVREDIKGVVQAMPTNVIVKVILETCYLTRDEIANACVIAMEAGASFVKTSTGFGENGAILDEVALMREVVGDRIGVKASGGIRDIVAARNFIAAGATRIGTSSGVAMMQQKKRKYGST